jgi:hypothetical protein
MGMTQQYGRLDYVTIGGREDAERTSKLQCKCIEGAVGCGAGAMFGRNYHNQAAQLSGWEMWRQFYRMCGKWLHCQESNKITSFLTNWLTSLLIIDLVFGLFNDVSLQIPYSTD